MTSSNIQSFRDLLVWQKAIALVTQVYVVTRSFPSEERYGLTSQIRRAAVSVPSNIAEGQGRNSRKEFLQFLGIARGSLQEVETQVRLAMRFHYLTGERGSAIVDAIAEVSRILNGLVSSLTTDH